MYREFERKDTRQLFRNGHRRLVLILFLTCFPLAASTVAKAHASARSEVCKQEQNTEEDGIKETASKDKVPDSVKPNLLNVPLPLKSKHVRQLVSLIENTVLEEDVPEGEQSILVLRFDTGGSVDGNSSSYSACDELASFLTSRRMANVRTVAYLPPPGSGKTGDGGGLRFKSQLTGHALMVALACRKIWMHSDSSLVGFALDPDHVDKELHTYQSISKKGVKWPDAVLRKLLGQRGGLYQVKKTDGRVVYVDRKRREEIRKDGLEVRASEISPDGQKVVWKARQLFEWTLVDTPVLGAEDIVQRLGGASLMELKPKGRQKNPVAALLKIDVLDDSLADWAPRAIGSSMTGNNTNLLFVQLETLGSESMTAAGRLADFLSSRDQQSLKTVAILTSEPSPGEILVAMACDQIIFPKDGTLGPVDQASVSLGDHEMLDVIIRDVAKRKNRDWSLIKALVLNQQGLAKYRNRISGTSRVLTAIQHESLADAEDWVLGDSLKIQQGLTAQKAFSNRIVHFLESDPDRIQDKFFVTEWRVLQPNASDRWVQSVARFISSPGIASLVIMLAMFTMFIELSAPGLGVPGFLSACLFCLFFWANYLEGNAEWLEIILFLLGLAFLGMEVFVIPGFGLFGIGGIICVAISLILAGQDFVIPQTTAERQQLIASLFTLVTASLGVFAGIYVVRRYFKSIPVLNRMVLEAPGASTMVLEEERKADLQKYLNQTGTAVTVMRPGGKVRLGVEVTDAFCEAGYMEKGAKIVVTKIENGRLFVRELDA